MNTLPTCVFLGIKRRVSASAVVPATPTAELSDLAIATPPPTPPTVLLPIHARARALLRPTCNNTGILVAGRDSERAVIRDYLTSFLASDSLNRDAEVTSLYISGSPGTGKTALVDSILRSLPTSDIRLVMVNCMALGSIEALWERLAEEFQACNTRKISSRAKKGNGRELVEALLSKIDSKWLVNSVLLSVLGIQLTICR